MYIQGEFLIRWLAVASPLMQGEPRCKSCSAGRCWLWCVAHARVHARLGWLLMLVAQGEDWDASLPPERVPFRLIADGGAALAVPGKLRFPTTYIAR